MAVGKIVYLPIVCLLWKATLIESRPEGLSLPKPNALPPNYNDLPAGTCEKTDWPENLVCPNGLKEMFHQVNAYDGTTSWKKCCTPQSKAAFEARRQIFGTKCDKSECTTDSNPCSTLDQYYINGQAVPFYPVVQDTCIGRSGIGNIAVCCLTNSSDALEASMGSAENHEFPHIVRTSTGCGGTIYDKRHIITAAHCVVTDEVVEAPESIIVTVGTNINDVNDRRSQEFRDRRYIAEEIIVHENYSKLPGNYEKFHTTMFDVAIVRLNQDIAFGPNVKALKFAPSGFDSLKYTENAVIAGWGAYDEAQEGTWQLQKSNVIIRDGDICASIWPSLTNFQSQVMCVGGAYGGKFSPISGHGDSGGPVICRDESGHPVLCGVASMGGNEKACSENRTEANCFPSVYSKIHFYEDWILLKTNNNQNPSTIHSPFLYGEPVPEERFEHQVHVISSKGKSCGGTLIAPDTVVTAAQCVSNEDGSKMNVADVTVMSGIRDVKSTGNSHEVQNIQVLNGFERAGKPVDVASQGDRVSITDNYFRHDLAVIKLRDSVNISPNKLAKLPSSRDFSQDELASEVSFPRNSTMFPQLMQREFRFLAKEDCKRRWNTLDYLGYKVNIDDDILCGVETYSGGSQCDRELGGGLICKGSDGSDELCGVQVFRLCEFTLPNGFVDVAMHKSWMQNAMNS